MSPPSSGDEYAVNKTEKAVNLNNRKSRDVAISMLNAMILELKRPKILDGSEVSPDLILPYGDSLEVRELKQKINRLPRELLQDQELIQECKEFTELVNDGNLSFWRHFFENNHGLETWYEKKKKLSLKRRLSDDLSAPSESQLKKARQDFNDQDIIQMQSGTYLHKYLITNISWILIL